MSQVHSASVGSPIDEARDYLNAIVPLMRELGVEEYDGLRLGPMPPSDAASREDDETQRLTPEKQVARAREERRRIAMAASGGPIRRVDT